MKFTTFRFTRIRESLGDMEEPENFALVAGVIWRALLVVIVIAALLVIAYGFSLLKAALSASDTPRAVAQRSAAADPNRKDIDLTAAGFAARKNAYDQLKAQPISAPDPSK